ncbi:MAG: MFS transporter [Thermoplasmata archaeon]
MKNRDTWGYQNLTTIFVISFMAQIPLTTLRFVVPIYAEHYGAGIFIIGLLGTAYGFTYSISAFFFGKISDKIGYGKLAIMGLLSYAAISILYSFFDHPYQFVVGKSLEGISMAMIWPSLEALSSKLGAKNKEMTLLLYTVAWSVGSSISPYLSAYLIKFSFTYPLIFSAVVSVAGVYFVLKSKVNSSKEFIDNNGRVSIAYDIVLPMALYGVDSSIFYSFYPVYGIVSGFGLRGTGLLGTFYGIFLTVAFIFSFLLSKRIRSRNLIIIGTLIDVPVLLLLVSRSIVSNLVIVSLLGSGLGLVYFSVLINIFRYFSEGLGSKTGVFEASIGAGYVLGPTIAGIPTVLGYRLPWLTYGVFTIAIAIILLLGPIKKRKQLKNG